MSSNGRARDPVGAPRAVPSDEGNAGAGDHLALPTGDAHLIPVPPPRGRRRRCVPCAPRVCGTAPIPDGEGLSQFAERICTEKTGVAGQGGCFAQIVTLPNGNAVPVGFQPGTTLLYKCKRCGPFWPDNCGCHDDLPCPSNHDWVGGPEGACQNTGRG